MEYSIELLEKIGANLSIKQYESTQQMLHHQDLDENNIKFLIDSNLPIFCGWSKEGEDGDEEEEEKEKEKNETKIIFN